MPTLIAWALRAAAAALAVRWIVKERRRVNQELYGSGGAEAAARAGERTLRPDGTGVYRPDQAGDGRA